MTAVVGVAGCAAAQERSVRHELQQASRRLADRAATPGDEKLRLDGTLDGYVTYAMAHSPVLRARFHRWRAQVKRISRARRLPDPKLSYTYFIRSIETRVGPQRHKLQAEQRFPWPTELTAGADAASLAARAEQRKFEARALELERRVARAFWQLWQLQRIHMIETDQDEVLSTLVESVRGRMETGRAALTDLLDAQLALTRHLDHHDRHRQRMHAARARLAEAAGVSAGMRTPVEAETPEATLPAEDERSLHEAALRHPRIDTHRWLAKSKGASARHERAERLPEFGLGLGWTQIGEARSPGVQGSSKDAVSVTVSMELPIWQGSYREDVEAAHAEAEAHRADATDARQRAHAELERALSRVRDTSRRIQLYDDTLVPQAESAYNALLGSYQSGQADLTQLLTLEKRWLELRVELARARARHERAWADLEHAVGRTIARRARGTDREEDRQ